MRIIKLLLFSICAIAWIIGDIGCTSQSVSGPGATPGAVVTVQYINPAGFTDFNVQGRDTQSSTEIFTREVTRALEPRMANRFPGDQLILQFTNIDLAGSRTPGPRSVRVVRNRTPARLSFNYFVRDAHGRLAASGSQTLVDTERLSRSPGPSGPLSAETQMLQRWLQRLPLTR